MLARPLDRRWLAAAAALFVLDIALHLPIEDVFDDVARRYGFFWYDALAQRVFIALGVALVAALWWWARPAHRSVVRRATIAVVVAMLLAKGFLLVAAIENIHYPQYALVVIALARAGLALEPSWLIAVGLGVVDEYYQFVMLPRGTPNYLDADDIVLNAIGGTAWRDCRARLVRPRAGVAADSLEHGLAARAAGGGRRRPSSCRSSVRLSTTRHRAAGTSTCSRGSKRRSRSGRCGQACGASPRVGRAAIGQA